MYFVPWKTILSKEPLPSPHLSNIHYINQSTTTLQGMTKTTYNLIDTHLSYSHSYFLNTQSPCPNLNIKQYY